MEKLFSHLKEIDSLLEQIGTITANQTTVLLQSEADSDEQFSLIEAMVEYKEELINQLQEVEMSFDQEYKQKREQVNDRQYIFKFKECVAKILEKKQRIQDMEQNNIRIMQSRSSQKRERITILKDPKEVVSAYKKQQLK